VSSREVRGHDTQAGRTGSEASGEGSGADRDWFILVAVVLDLNSVFVVRKVELWKVIYISIQNKVK
jgi:hypothetical protein